MIQMPKPTSLAWCSPQHLCDLRCDIVAQYRRDFQMSISLLHTKPSHLVPERLRVQCARICNNLDLLVDDDVDAFFELGQKTNFVALRWITGFGYSIPSDVHLG